MFTNVWLSLVVVVTQFTPCSGQYSCVCNYSPGMGVTVYDHPATHATRLGYMWEFDCKPAGDRAAHGHFLQIMFENQVGYVENSTTIKPELCEGPISSSDLVTIIATKSSSTTTTTTTAVTTPKPTTSTTLSTTTTSTTTRPPTTTRTTSPSTEHTTPPTTTRTTTEHSPGQTSVPEGHIDLCPQHVANDLAIFKGFLGQYGDFCFELVDIKTQWHNAQRHCSVAGNGYIAHVSSQQEQDYFMRFLANHTYVESIWLGLTDSEKEGATVEGKWTWISGDPLTYTNFGPDFNSHTNQTHALNDCVIMKNKGEWTDVHCGVALVFGTGFGESHPVICQYNVTSKPPNIFNLGTDIIIG